MFFDMSNASITVKYLQRLLNIAGRTGEHVRQMPATLMLGGSTVPEEFAGQDGMSFFVAALVMIGR